MELYVEIVLFFWYNWFIKIMCGSVIMEININIILMLSGIFIFICVKVNMLSVLIVVRFKGNVFLMY